ncbi:MAG: DUF4124 domain-containing protein [Proteobacteria bacterium]|nr:DUF4124 domain-containing protein [Pseudomonadota bacterium]
MARILTFTLILLAAVPLAVAATVYKWTDENGVVHYSDQPHPNAQKLHIEGAQTYKAGTIPVTSDSGVAAPAAPGPAYQGCNIIQPADDETLSNIDALNITVRTDPVLRAGDQVFLSMDGQALNGGAPTGTSFSISPVDRGTHTLQVLVRGSDGSLLCQGPSVTVHVHQVSVNNPANPQHQAPPPPQPRSR